MRLLRKCFVLSSRVLVLAVLTTLAKGDLLDVFRSQKCYSPLGCFSNDAPFNNAWDELPDSPEEVGLTLTLYTRRDPLQGHALNYKDAKSVRGSTFNPDAEVKVIIHGYDNDGTEPWVKGLVREFLKVGDYNIIKAAWGPGAHKLYPQSVANTRVVGAAVAHFLTSLKDVHNVSMSRVHLLGHSLGAHISGYVGSRVKGIARISGMDPAGPLFEKVSPAVRIDPTDAVFVDCIHSDGLPMKQFGFGTISAWCDADYYPNGGGLQPGCPPPVSHTLTDVARLKLTDAGVDVSCSHSRSHDYYVASIATCRFPASHCSSFSAYTSGQCNGSPPSGSMGFHAGDKSARGKFFLNTTATSPYC